MELRESGRTARRVVGRNAARSSGVGKRFRLCRMSAANRVRLLWGCQEKARRIRSRQVE
jgi:hypothetical protein